MQETRFNSWVRKIRWRRDRLPTPVFLGFPGGSAGKESACNVGNLSSIGFGKIPWRRERLPTPVIWPGEFHGLYSPWDHEELDTTGQFSLSRIFALFCGPTFFPFISTKLHLEITDNMLKKKKKKDCLFWGMTLGKFISLVGRSL